MEKISALYARYVIDGIPQELSPGEMLDECLAAKDWRDTPVSSETILDETVSIKSALKDDSKAAIEAMAAELLA